VTATLRRSTDPVPTDRRRGGPRQREPRRASVALAAWWVVLLVAAAALVVDRFHRLPSHVAPAAAGVFGIVLVLGLVVRTGGQPLLPVVLATGYAAAAVLTLQPLLLGGAAAGVGAAAAVLAVMGTVPAVRFRHAIREVVLACALATVAGLAVAAFGRPAGVAVDRFTYLVLAGALLGCFALVYRLGAGFHGLGRRGYAVAAGATLLLAIALAYSEAVGRWGSPALVNGIDDVRVFVRAHAGAVPHPIETLLGVPALCWGTFMRARRRQGWWVCAFGAAVPAPATTRFLIADVPVHTTVLGAVYSLVLGLALGWGAVRAEQVLTGSRGRRARRDEEAAAHRPEPARFEPLQ
jgi:hypothetical protein